MPSLAKNLFLDPLHRNIKSPETAAMIPRLHIKARTAPNSFSQRLISIAGTMKTASTISILPINLPIIL